MSRRPGSPSVSCRSASKKQREDTYIDVEETATLCANFVTHLFECPELPANCPANSRPLKEFTAYALRRTRLSSPAIFTALYLLERLKTRYPIAKGSSGHRLIITTFMITCKVVQDNCYSNRSWAVVARDMFPVKDISQMEREVLAYLDWDLSVDPVVLLEFETRIRRIFSGPGPYTTYSLPGPGVHPYRPFRGPPKAAAACAVRVVAPVAQPPAAPRPSARSPSTSPMDVDPSPPIHTSPSTDAMECTPELSGSKSSSPAWSVVSPATPARCEGLSFPAVGAGKGTICPTVTAQPQEPRSSDAMAGTATATQGLPTTRSLLARAMKCVW